jgi:transposase
VRNVIGLLVRRPEVLRESEQQRLHALLAHNDALAVAYRLTRAFAALLHEVKGGDSRALRAFAEGLARDRAAVVAGMTREWSAGPVEGHVNRAKLVKREMFGRANLDLLRRRVLLAG